MTKYIPKADVVAEIEKRRDAALTRQHNLNAIGQETVLNEMLAYELNRIISFLDTIEVKEVVDLDKEYIRNICLLYEQVYKEFWNEHDSLDDVYEEVLKRLKAQKGE